MRCPSVVGKAESCQDGGAFLVAALRNMGHIFGKKPCSSSLLASVPHLVCLGTEACSDCAAPSCDVLTDDGDEGTTVVELRRGADRVDGGRSRIGGTDERGSGSSGACLQSIEHAGPRKRGSLQTIGSVAEAAAEPWLEAMLLMKDRERSRSLQYVFEGRRELGAELMRPWYALAGAVGVSGLSESSFPRSQAAESLRS
jgi:hypothetical protein